MEGKFVLTVSLDSEFCLTEIFEPILPKKHTSKGRFDKLGGQIFNQPLKIESAKIKDLEKMPHFWFYLQEMS